MNQPIPMDTDENVLPFAEEYSETIPETTHLIRVPQPPLDSSSEIIPVPVPPPYQNFASHRNVKFEISRTNNEHSCLFIYGYSGSGKTTIIQQRMARDPNSIIYIPQCGMKASSNILGELGEKVGLSVKQRKESLNYVSDKVIKMGHRMIVFDDMDLVSTNESYERIKLLISIYKMTGQPVIIIGTREMYEQLTKDRGREKYDIVNSQIIPVEMKGMTHDEAIDYLDMIKEKENVDIEPTGKEALANVGRDSRHNGIKKFMDITASLIANQRAIYYTHPGRGLPPEAQCVEQITVATIAGPAKRFIYRLPRTKETLTISNEAVQKEIQRILGESGTASEKRRKKYTRKPPSGTAADSSAGHST